MNTIFGSGEYRYRIVDDWAKLPPGWRLGDVAGDGVEAGHLIFLFHTGVNSLIVIDRDQKYLRR